MNVNPLRRFALILTAGLLCLLAGTDPGFAQGGGPIVAGQKVVIHSSILNEDRTLWVSTPDTAFSATARYPVIYLLDGDSHFLHTSGIVQFLSNNNKMPAMIVVGVLNTNRSRDLTPLPADTAFQGSGGADRFLKCITDEIIPYVDAHYTTAPFRILIGHSFGGIFALNALLTRPETFNGYIIISPSLWWGKDTLVSQTRTFLKGHDMRRTFVYETIGNEGPRMVTPSLQLKNVVESNTVEGLEWKIRLMEAEDHGTTVLRSIYDGLESIFSPWKLRGDLVAMGMAEIERHYHKLSDHYGYDIEVPEPLVNNLGYQYLTQNKLDEAIAVFTWNVRHYPQSWNVYDSLGEAFAKKGDTAAAIENYEKSVAMNPDNTNGKQFLKKLKGS